MVEEKQIGDKLSMDDVKDLLENPSEEARTSTADKLSKQFVDNNFSDSEKLIAEEIFRIMVKDVEVRVRATLAENLKKTSMLPADVAKAMANDVDEVALPIIQFSQVLSDADLIEIIGGGSETKQIAVASRPIVTEDVSHALVEHGQEQAVATLISNQGAQIKEESFQVALNRFPESETVKTPMALREKLPMNIAAALVEEVSQDLQKHILANHDLPPDVVANLVMQSQEKTTIGLSSRASEEETTLLVSELLEKGRLTPSILIRSLCMGETKFFEHAMAIISKLPLHNVRVLIYDSGDLGFKGLYEKAKLPAGLYAAFAAAIEVIKETELDGEDNDIERFTRKVIERILTQAEEESDITMQGSDIEYLLEKMGEFINE